MKEWGDRIATGQHPCIALGPGMLRIVVGILPCSWFLGMSSFLLPNMHIVDQEYPIHGSTGGYTRGCCTFSTFLINPSLVSRARACMRGKMRNNRSENQHRRRAMGLISYLLLTGFCTSRIPLFWPFSHNPAPTKPPLSSHSVRNGNIRRPCALFSPPVKRVDNPASDPPQRECW